MTAPIFEVDQLRAHYLTRFGAKIQAVDGVTFALPGTDAETDRYLNAGGRLAADRFSLIQRGIAEEALRPQARATDMDEVAGWVLDPDIRVVWH